MAVAAEPIYQAYAPIYDAIGQGQFSVRMASWALTWLAESGMHQPLRVLDLACGTGEAALTFAAAGCQVAGLDRSPAMIEIARGKARDAGYAIELVRGDMRALEPRIKNQEPDEKLGSWFSVLGSQFDLLTCFYDSLNYLVDDGDLERVCAGVARVLRPGGYMIFDLNSAAEYATWDEHDSVTYDGRDCLVYNQLNYDPEAYLATGRIVWFVRELDRWWRGEETHVERAWGDHDVRAALDGAGLALVGRFDPKGGLAEADAPRVVYVARRLTGAIDPFEKR